jgi:hypothetical protein
MKLNNNLTGDDCLHIPVREGHDLKNALLVSGKCSLPSRMSTALVLVECYYLFYWKYRYVARCFRRHYSYEYLLYGLSRRISNSHMPKKFLRARNL